MDDYLALIDRTGAKTLMLANGHQAYKVIVHSNQLQQHMNGTSVFEFARSRNQPLFIFMAAHHCIDKVNDWWSLAVVDHGSNSSGPSLFIFTKGMPIVIHQNFYTSFGIVNGKEATAVGFALDESANVYSFGDNTVGEYFQTMVL